MDTESSAPPPPASPSAEELEHLSNLDDKSRPIELLSTIGRNEHVLLPIWSVHEERGYTYFPSISSNIKSLLEEDLRLLARRDYLRLEFVDRLTRCRYCNSFVLNVRETCITCESPNITSFPVLHHFRCGYVAPITRFAQADNGRVCPKCHGALNYRATDHEVVGEQFTCNSCLANFDEPEVRAHCLCCNREQVATHLVFEDVYAYRLTRLGLAAIRSGRLFEEEPEQLYEADLPIFRRSVFESLLRDEARRRHRYDLQYALLIFRVGDADSPGSAGVFSDTFIKTLRSSLRDVDQVGRWNDAVLIANLPATSVSGAELARQRLRDSLKQAGLTVSHIEVLDGPKGENAVTSLANMLDRDC